MKKMSEQIKDLLQETYDECISMSGDTADAEETAKRRATEQLTQYYYTRMQIMNEMLYHAVRESSISADRYYQRTIGAYEKLAEELADVAAETGIKVDHHRAVWKPDWAAIDNIEHCTYDTRGNARYAYLFDIVCLQDAKSHCMYKVERARDNVYCQISRWEFEGLLASYAAAQIKTDNEDISRDALQDETMKALYADRRLPWLLLLRNIMSRQVDEIKNALDLIYLDRYPYIETRCLQALDELIGDELTDLLSDLPHEKGKGENRGFDT